jgi:hypothetical protein
VGSVVGYVENPAAILTRGLAHGLALRGNDVRIVEERQNHAFARTLRTVGSGAARHFHDAFTLFQHHTFERRSGAPLLEWVSREIALIDAAVAVSGLGDELCQWIANVTREELVRAYLTWDAAELTRPEMERLGINDFDLLLAPTLPDDISMPWRQISKTVADADRKAGLT